MDWWEKLRPHEVQHQLWRCNKKFVYVVAGRGSGKTLLARRKICLSLAIQKPWIPKYAYCLPTFTQAKRVVWYEIIEMLKQKDFIISDDDCNKSEMTIKTRFGSILYVVGMDRPERIEGIQLDGVVVDESSDQRPGMFNKTLVPMLTHRDGWAWRIGVPKKTGIGRAEFRAGFNNALKGLEDNSASFTWKSGTVLTQEQIDQAKSIMTAEEFSEQFDANWLDAGGSIYYAFTTNNVSDEARYDPTQPIVVGSDFNVDPMCWVLGHWKDEKLVIFEELFIKDTNTPATLKFLAEKYAAHKSGWRFTGDAAGRQRKTTAAKSDYLLIKNDDRFENKTVYFPNKNPALKDRFSSVNAGLCNAKGEIRILINPKCKRLIMDLESCSYKEGTTEPEDYRGTDIGHMVDAFGYAVMRYMPLRLNAVSQAMVVVT